MFPQLPGTDTCKKVYENLQDLAKMKPSNRIKHPLYPQIPPRAGGPKEPRAIKITQTEPIPSVSQNPTLKTQISDVSMICPFKSAIAVRIHPSTKI